MFFCYCRLPYSRIPSSCSQFLRLVQFSWYRSPFRPPIFFLWFHTPVFVSCFNSSVPEFPFILTPIPLQFFFFFFFCICVYVFCYKGACTNTTLLSLCLLSSFFSVIFSLQQNPRSLVIHFSTFSLCSFCPFSYPFLSLLDYKLSSLIPRETMMIVSVIVFCPFVYLSVIISKETG